MIARASWVLMLLSICLFSTINLRAEEFQLSLVPTSTIGKDFGYKPRRIEMSSVKPEGVVAIPAGVTAPLYGTLVFGPQENPRSFDVLLDEPDGKPSHLYVDANGDGDFTNDPPTVWTRKSYKESDGKWYTILEGAIQLPLQFAGKEQLVTLNVYRFDEADPVRSASRNLVLYYNKYGASGKINLDGRQYSIFVYEDWVTGDFRGPIGTGQTRDTPSEIEIRNAKGRNAAYSAVGGTFKLGHKTYKVSSITADGSRITIDPVPGI